MPVIALRAEAELTPEQWAARWRAARDAGSGPALDELFAQAMLQARRGRDREWCEATLAAARACEEDGFRGACGDAACAPCSRLRALLQRASEQPAAGSGAAQEGRLRRKG